MYIISIVILCLCIGATIGSNCQDISGFWRNQLGSNVTIILSPGNYITGEYSTAVESKENAALISSNLTGIFKPLEKGALLSFTVLFNHGKSLTTWVGQCIVCDGEEILFTSWLLRSHFSKRDDRWMSSNIEQDVFKRVKNNEVSIPTHLSTAGPSKKDERSSTCEDNLKVSGNGHWISDNGDTLLFDSCHESGVFSGVHLTSQNSIVGRSDGEPHFTAVGFMAASSDEVKGWTGHIYDRLSESESRLETLWLAHTFSESCKNPSNFARLGKNIYTFTVNDKEKADKEESMARRFYNYVMSFF